MSHLILTEDGLKELKEAYRKAVQEKKEEFTFKGHALVTQFAKYVIQHAETELKNRNHGTGN